MTHCNQCDYCEDESGPFERRIPHLDRLGSGCDERKGDTALCKLHNIFMLPGPACGDFASRFSAASTPSTTTQ